MRQEILRKAIEGAIENNYKLPFEKVSNAEIFNRFRVEIDFDITISTNFSIVADRYSYYKVIFSHDFAKAFFGDESINKRPGEFPGDYVSAWEYYLQEMVLEEDPILYLNEYL